MKLKIEMGTKTHLKIKSIIVVRKTYYITLTSVFRVLWNKKLRQKMTELDMTQAQQILNTKLSSAAVWKYGCSLVFKKAGCFQHLFFLLSNC